MKAELLSDKNYFIF